MNARTRRTTGATLYDLIIGHLFQTKYVAGARELHFVRQDIRLSAEALGVEIPGNLGDVVYHYRTKRGELPTTIKAAAPPGEEWIILGRGKARYRFVAVPPTPIEPNSMMVEIKIPDATPGIITKYAQSDEQALLAQVRYNRLIDVFTGVTCYSLQNHYRTTVEGMGQVETDEVYVGVDRRGAHYVFPVQAKGKRDKQGVVQILQDIAMCAEKFPDLICRPIAVQFTVSTLIALFELEEKAGVVGIVSEKHYRLVPPADVTEADLAAYKTHALS